MFNDLVREIIKELEQSEQRQRVRRESAQINFEYCVEYLLTQLWKNALSIPPSKTPINRYKGYYSECPRYRDGRLTYNQMMAVFKGMIDCRLIEVTDIGYYDRLRMTGETTRIIPTDQLLDRLEKLEGHPAITLAPNTNEEVIILRDKIEGRKVDIDYKETVKTETYRANLRRINDCLIKHWIDLRIKDSEVSKLADRIHQDNSKNPIDLSRRILTRIFANGSFEEGGRFYRGWWQNVPSEYRRYITIDEGITTEYDYSQLSPHMLYFAYNKEMGNEDAYDRVLDGAHRDVVKQSFNAMVQSTTALNQKPDNISLDGLEMNWKDLRERILDTHKPIQHLFFIGIGNKLQFKDSQIAESIMLQFTNDNQVCLPIHDSFIMRQGFAGDLEEAMRRAFYEQFQSDIPIKQDIIAERVALFEEDGTPRTDEVTKDDREHSQWYDRNTLWLYHKGRR